MRRFNRLLIAAAALAALAILGACSMSKPKDELKPTVAIDLPRYMGTWYIVANIPYFFENGKVATRDVYALRDDGRIDNTFLFKKAFDEPDKSWNAIGDVVPGKQNALWKVKFFLGLLRADYLVVDVDPDYQWSMVGYPDRKYGWVLARDLNIDDTTVAKLVNRFAEYGYDPAVFRRVPQTPADLGKPGFAGPD